MLILYSFLILNYVLLSRLYFNRKIDDNEMKIFVLSLLVILLSVHSFLIIGEMVSGYNIGLYSFWKKDTYTPKSSYGYVFGALFFVLYILVFSYLKKKIPFRKKIRIIRKIIQIENIKSYSVIYLSGVILVFIVTFFTMLLKSSLGEI